MRPEEFLRRAYGGCVIASFIFGSITYLVSAIRFVTSWPGNVAVVFAIGCGFALIEALRRYPLSMPITGLGRLKSAIVRGLLYGFALAGIGFLYALILSALELSALHMQPIIPAGSALLGVVVGFGAERSGGAA